MESTPGQPSGILFGAAYYAEYHRDDRTVSRSRPDAATRDSRSSASASRCGRLGSRATANSISTGCSRCSTAHTSAASRSSSAPPPTPCRRGCSRRIPRSPPSSAPASRSPWGARQEVDYSHPAFLLPRRTRHPQWSRRYAEHPAVIGYQVDNEPGMLLFHNRGTFRRFVARLKAQYGDVETLNREWGLTYWSHRLSRLVGPVDARRQHAAPVRPRLAALPGRPHHRVHRLAGGDRPRVRAARPVRHDVHRIPPARDRRRGARRRARCHSGNPYYAMQDHLDLTKSLDSVTPWTTSGVPGLFRQADRLFSSNQARFFVTETDAQSIGGSGVQPPALPGPARSRRPSR